MKKIIITALLCASLCTAAHAADDIDVQMMTNEQLLADYTALAREIAEEREALADERAWMEEERSRRAVDDRLYDEMAAIIDKRLALLEKREAKLAKEIAQAEADRARFVEQSRIPVRRYTIKDPLIKRDLDKKIHRYWWLD